MALRKVELWLHDGAASGARTAFDGETFVSVMTPGAEGLAAAEALGCREAVFLFTGEDPSLDKPVAYLTAGAVSERARALMVPKARTVFSRLILLGGPGAGAYLEAVRAALIEAQAVVMLEGGGRSAPVTALPEAWPLLCEVLGVTLSGVTVPSGDDEKRAKKATAGLRLYCRGRGADAEARLEKGGIRILAGSRCSPLDATPSLLAPLRDTIKRLVDEKSLVKENGVWTFARDVRMPSPVQAASIVMRSSATAAHWETEDGDTLADRFARKPY